MSISRFPIASLELAALVLLLVSTNSTAAQNEHRPVCSPDGSRMIYMGQSERTGNDWELYQMVFSTRARNRLTTHEGWDGYPVWSPDGSRIIFDRENQPGEQKQPWVMDLENFTSRPLGHYEGQLSISDWSQDHGLLAFHETDGQRDLVLLDTDGNITERVTSTPASSEHDAHFSPDGSMIAYANGAVDGVETSLELFSGKDRNSSVLRTSIGRIYGISWSPDGRSIAYVDAPGGDEDDADIFILDLETRDSRQITTDPAWDHMPEYCNNPHILFFTSYRSGEERIYRIDPDPGPYLNIGRSEDQD